MPMDAPDSDAKEVFFMGAVVGGLCVLLLVLILGTATNAHTERSWQDRAVKDGKAEYYLDANNVRQWRWK